MKERSPQICCVITPGDKEILDELLKYARNKKGQHLRISTVVRGLIRLGSKNRDKIEL